MTLDKLIADVDAEEAQADRKAIAAIKAYDVERANEQQAKAQKDAHGNTLRDWFRTHPEEMELVDGEWGLRAFMETRRHGGHKYDLVAIIENNPALWTRLVSVRALTLDHDIAEANGLADEIKRYELPNGETQALQVKAIRR